MKNRVLALIVVLFVVGGTLAYAQQAAIEIGYPFVAGGKHLAAGKYTVILAGANVIALRGDGGSAEMTFLTRLGRHDNDTDLELVFDKIADEYLLSEVWFPEKDGYLVLSTKEAHEHAVLGGPHPKK